MWAHFMACRAFLTDYRALSADGSLVKSRGLFMKDGALLTKDKALLAEGFLGGILGSLDERLRSFDRP